jgi:hypothetical protein
MKNLFLFFVLLYFSGYAQKKIENIKIDWPAEYKWQIINQSKNKSRQSVTLIPGYETVKNASIIGTMVAIKGVNYSDLDGLITHYKTSIDTGSKLTLLERNDTNQPHWIIFKVETPVTPKYPEPESDLYYVVQGEYALYENYVAIKKENISQDFIKRWSEIFKKAALAIQ